MWPFDAMRVRSARLRVELQALRALEASVGDRFVSRIEDPDEGDWSQLLHGAGEQVVDRMLQSLGALRQNSRLLVRTNLHAQGIVQNLVNYTVGDELTVKITAPPFQGPSDDAEARGEHEGRAEVLVGRARAAWADWTGRALCPPAGWTPWCQEFVRRLARDGETFVQRLGSARVEGPEGGERTAPQLRYLEPEHIADPPDNAAGGYRFGVLVGEDAVRPRGYWHTQRKRQLDAARGTGSGVQHDRYGVDGNVPRGLPFLSQGLVEKVRSYEDWIGDRLVLNRIRAAIGLIRTHKATPAQLADAMANLRTGTATGTDSAGRARSVGRQRLRAGTIIDTNENVKYEYLSPNVGAADVSPDGRAVLLCIAAGLCWPEFLVSGDASNANYASTLVSFAPGVKALKSFQTFVLNCLWELHRFVLVSLDPAFAALSSMMQGPKIEAHDPEGSASANETLYRNKVISRATWQQREGVDPEEEDEAIAGDDTERPDDARDLARQFGAPQAPTGRPAAEPKA